MSLIHKGFFDGLITLRKGNAVTQTLPFNYF